MARTDSTLSASPTASGDARLRRYDRYAGILIATVVAVLVFAVIAGDGSATVSGRLGGDYPAFYGAGSIVLDGDIDDLYDAARQTEAQEGLLEDDGGFLYFAYPPPVAVAYAPLAALPYRISFLMHTFAMLALLFGAVWLLRPLVPFIERTPRVAMLIALTFYPMFRAVTGGQNTALTALLVAGSLRLEHDGRPFLAGLVAAGLLYKPQFGIPIAVLLIATPRLRMARGWVVGATAFFVVGAVASGPGWVGTWWSEATGFAEINEGVNGFLFVSLPGMVANTLGSGHGFGRLLWVGALAVAGGGVVYTWRRFEGPLPRWGLTAMAAVLLVPQALFYEVGLALLAFVAVGASGAAIAVLWILSWTQPAADTLSWSPLGVIAPVAFLWALRHGIIASRTTETT